MEPTSWLWLASTLRLRYQAIQTTITNGLASGSLHQETPVPTLGWTAGELVAHMVSVPRIYKGLVEDPASFEIPESMAAFGQTELEAVGTFDLETLAELLADATEQLLAALGDDGAAGVPFYTMEQTVLGLGGILLNEHLMHHRDLATVTNDRVEITPDDVRAMMRGMMPAGSIFYDRSVAERCPGTFHIHIRGGDDWTVLVNEGTVAVERAKPSRADLHINAAPVPFVLAAFGRESQIRAGLTGKIVAYGQKPWLLRPFTQLFIEELSKA